MRDLNKTVVDRTTTETYVELWVKSSYLCMTMIIYPRQKVAHKSVTKTKVVYAGAHVLLPSKSADKTTIVFTYTLDIIWQRKRVVVLRFLFKRHWLRRRRHHSLASPLLKRETSGRAASRIAS